LVGNGVATLVVAKWTGDLDMQRLHDGLNNPTSEELETPEVVLDQKEARMAAKH
jgi:aerobic C4-dicarboxylate transport protein